jgi:hypothetical protein
MVKGYVFTKGGDRKIIYASTLADAKSRVPKGYTYQYWI